ncbi:hypothetical protein C8Q80DRAFT_1124700 [Daedaleopsis nitida]|nr:hypothetical protein C8Q80DRAFT_1124700 [Daedaleopsis nitida]
MLTVFSGARQTKGKVAPHSASKFNTPATPAPKSVAKQSLTSAQTPSQRREQSIDYADERPRQSRKASGPVPGLTHHRRPPRKRPRQAPNAREAHPHLGSTPADDPLEDIVNTLSSIHNVAIGSPSEWIKTMSKLRPQSTLDQRKQDGYQTWYEESRETVRNVGHFVLFERVLRNGLKHWQTPLQEQPWTCTPRKSQGYDSDVEDMLIFEILLKRFKGLVDHVEELSKYPEVIKKIAAFLDAVLSRTRSDDLARLNLSFFAHIDGVTNPEIYKTICGFKDVILGRELIPPEYIEKYDEDAESFCAKILSGKIFYKSGCLPSFLIDLDKYNPNEPVDGFLRGNTLTNAIVLIYNGPGALAEFKGKHSKSKKGQRSIAKKYGVTDLTVEAVIYVAGLVQHVLCTPAEWNEKDGSYDIAQMTRKIKNMCLRNPTRMRKIMSWYSVLLFGKTDNSIVVNEDTENRTTYARMMAWEGNEIPDEPGAYYNTLRRMIGVDADDVQDLEVADPSGPAHSERDDSDEEEHHDGALADVPMEHPAPEDETVGLGA